MGQRKKLKRNFKIFLAKGKYKHNLPKFVEGSENSAYSTDCI